MRVGHVLEISDHHLEISDHHFKVEVVLVKLGWGWFGVKVTKRPRLTSLYLHRPDLVLIPRHDGGSKNTENTYISSSSHRDFLNLAGRAFFFKLLTNNDAIHQR